jgi:putative IMPACT (imprinted ancient) family translation regulator
LTNIVLVVTRYFGGVKLGVRGLIEAYGSVAEKTILSGEKTPVIDIFTYQCSMPYDFYNIFTHRIQMPEVVIVSTEYTDKVNVTLQVTEFKEKELINILKEMQNNQRFEYKT